MEQSDDLPRSRSDCLALKLASIWLHQSRLYLHLHTANASIYTFYLAQPNSLSLRCSWGRSSFHWTSYRGYWAEHALYYRGNKSHRAISLRISLPRLGASSLLGYKHRIILTLLSQTQNYLIKRMRTTHDLGSAHMWWNRWAVSQRTSITCSFVFFFRMRLSQGIETEGAGNLLM